MKEGSWRGWGALLAAAAPKLFTLSGKLAKSAKFAKLGWGGATMASYSWLYGWRFAVVIMAALIVHESGHVWAMRRAGVPTKGFYLIPFVGGAAIASEEIRDRRLEYFIVMAGPAFGLASALAPLLVYAFTGTPLWAGIAAWVAFVNLINLLPILPLDGGKIVGTIAYSTNSRLGLALAIGGLVVCGVALFYLGAALIGLLLAFGCVETVATWKRRDADIAPFRGSGILGAIIGYLALALCLVLIMKSAQSVPEARLALDLLKD